MWHLHWTKIVPDFAVGFWGFVCNLAPGQQFYQVFNLAGPYSYVRCWHLHPSVTAGS